MLWKVAVAGGCSGIDAMDHRSDARWRGDSPTLTSLDSHRAMGAAMPGGIDLTRPPVGRWAAEQVAAVRWRGM